MLHAQDSVLETSPPWRHALHMDTDPLGQICNRTVATVVTVGNEARVEHYDTTIVVLVAYATADGLV